MALPVKQGLSNAALSTEQPPPYSVGGGPPGYYSGGPQPPSSGYVPGAPQPLVSGYNPGGPIVQQPVPGPTLVVQQFRETPQRTVCPSCRVEILTTTEHKNGGMTWLCMGILCMSCLWWGPCLIPLCVDSAKDVEHTCPNCKAKVGYFNKLG